MSRTSFLTATALLVACAACTRPGGPGGFANGEFPSDAAVAPSTGAGGVDGDIAIMAENLTCAPAQSSEAYPARSLLTAATTGMAAAAEQPKYFTADLYNLFKAVCGGCHVDSSLGNFQVTSGSFKSQLNAMFAVGAKSYSVYEIITSNDTAVFMPPAAANGVPFNKRAPTDAVVELANLLKLWLDQGSPSDAFNLPAQPASATSVGYKVSKTLSGQLTNLGSCIPPKGMFAADPSAMDKLDAFFAKATTLPPTLDATDLVTLDSEALAKTGVVSYAPTYPLWTDNAGKMRYVRVPNGQSIKFDKATQRFDIPPNTRFYKTFLKSIIDTSGNAAWRKIETRVIVSRPDVDNADGTTTQTALYGTYLWDDDETTATLLTDPLRDGLPFADHLFTYITDESKAQAIIAAKPTNLTDALSQAGLSRHYAVPGSERCVQCHEGSPSDAFVLGFTPLQVARRASGGGLYEPAAGDELTQLQRLIDYGVITGVTAPTDITPLEQSEGSRLPRSDEELAAQAYMVGNCAHCHNPRGFPSVKQPLLKDVLIFLPGTGPGEGIFQMPLDLVSPIRNRGINKDVTIPYITPSLYDMPSPDSLDKTFCPDLTDDTCTSAQLLKKFVLAPWRSLIYRNTDTPYDYFDDYAPFPHMPLNSPGYDCRVAKIMGDWMVSIPAKLKDPTKIENVEVDTTTGEPPPNADTDAQPYVEVEPGDPDYTTATAARDARVRQYHGNGYRYNFCPSSYTNDIVDPVIEQEVATSQPVLPDDFPITDPTNPNKVLMPSLTPIRPHWVDFDDTDPPGPWFPRRPDWADALVNPNIPTFVKTTTAAENLTSDQAEDLTNVLEALGSVTLSDDVRAKLKQAVPFGLWNTSTPGCNFAGIPTAGSFQGAARPTWMAVAPPDPSAPVYSQSPGAAVFTSVCFNCHGENADSKGLLADEISIFTGGDARVADFRDGLFGPVASPGMNRGLVFDPAAATLGGGVTGDDLAGRYMSWMALGGTAKHLPDAVLSQVSTSPVLGQLRAHVAQQGTPDMLRIGLSLCEQIATSDVEGTQLSVSGLLTNGRYDWSQYTGLIDSNGDAEMWLSLCNLNNRPIVRVLVADSDGWTATSSASTLTATGYQLYWAKSADGTQDDYGANPVMDHHGNVANGITADNLFPICVQKPTDATQKMYADQALARAAAKGIGNAIPYCPDGFVDPSRQLLVTDAGDCVDGRRWAARGAINAALAVFLYLDQIERDPSTRQPLYTECNLIGKL